MTMKNGKKVTSRRRRLSKTRTTIVRKKPDLAKNVVNVLSKKGIIIPVLRDPLTQKPSVSYSLLTTSATLVIVGMFSPDVDASTALQFFYACAGLYFGRKLSFGRNITFNNNKG